MVMHSNESINHLVAEFAASVERQNDAMREHDAKTGNKYAERRIIAFRKLKSIGKKGLDALTALLDDERRDVRTMAACFLLRHSNEDACRVLKASASEKGVTGLGALMTLKRWEDGTWNLDNL